MRIRLGNDWPGVARPLRRLGSPATDLPTRADLTTQPNVDDRGDSDRATGLTLTISIAIGALGAFTLLVSFLGRADDFIIHLSAILLIGAVVVARRGRSHDVTLHAIGAVLWLQQVFVLDVNRDEPNVGVIWFFLLPTTAALLGRRSHVVVWGFGTLAGVLITWARAVPGDPLWAHPLTLPNLIGASLACSVASLGILRVREDRHRRLVRALDESRLAEERSRAAELKARRAVAERQRFVATMSHEFRTPMQSLLLGSELLMADPTTGKVAEIANAMEATSSSLIAVLNDVLDLSKIDAEQAPAVIQPYSPVNVIEDVAVVIGRQARAARSVLIADIRPDTPAFSIGDPGRLRQVLMNLVSNAVRATSSGAIRVRIERADGELKLTVDDTGRGIDECDLERIFDPYVRIEHDVQHPGTGLGLAIARRFTDAMGGRLEVQSTLGRGSSFAIRLPEPQLPDARLASVAFAPDTPALRHRSVSLRSENDWALRRAQAWCDYFGITVAEQARVIDLDEGAGHSRPNERLETLFSVIGVSSGPVDPVSSLAAKQARRCLVVEDDPTVRSVLTESLEALGHTVASAPDGESALRLAAGALPEVIFLDLTMPGMSGVETLGAIRERFGSTVSVCVLSGNVGARHVAIEAGADDFLTKPCRLGELSAAIERSRTEETEPTAARVSN